MAGWKNIEWTAIVVFDTCWSTTFFKVHFRCLQRSRYNAWEIYLFDMKL